MPIVYRIDHESRLVLARGYGVVTDADVFGYKCAAWAGTDVVGFDEMIDMTEVTEIALPSTDRIQELASAAAQMDSASAPSKLAIVAPGDLAYGLGRMFQVYRESEERSTKEVGVFRTLAEALAFLGLKAAPAHPPIPPET